jgi:excinuclease ABC subunit C
VSAGEYANLVGQARAFLTGDSDRIQREMAAEMEAVSERLEFELAAELRDRIRAMTNVQSRHGINAANIAEADVVALHQAGGQTCIQVFFFRVGYNYGNRAYYPSHASDAEPEQIMEAFIGQFYADKLPPKLLLVSHELPERALLVEALSEKAGYRVKVEIPKRGEKRELVDHARMNARDALARRLAESASQRRLLEGLAEALDLDRPPARIEVFDNSHVSGSNAVGAMIVAGPEGPMKNSYRKFNIRSVTAAGEASGGARRGDDYAMMREVLTRRFSRVIKEDPERARDQWPDLVLIDGGAGHLRVAIEVFAELGITDVGLAAISKGPDRNAGRERIHLPGRPPFRLDSRDPVLYFLQRLRDEAHRFAIGTHRAKRSRKIETSPLDEIPGVGGVRKRALLHHFGSARAVAQAGFADLEAVEGISAKIAERIYDWFHSDR